MNDPVWTKLTRLREAAVPVAEGQGFTFWGTSLLVLPLAPPLNNLYPSRGKVRVKSARYRAWEDEAAGWYLMQGFQHLPREDPALHWYLDMVMFMPNWGSGDLDNRNKATIDFLCSMRGLQDKYLMRLREVRVTDGSRLAGMVLHYAWWG